MVTVLCRVKDPAQQLFICVVQAKWMSLSTPCALKLACLFAFADQVVGECTAGCNIVNQGCMCTAQTNVM